LKKVKNEREAQTTRRVSSRKKTAGPAPPKGAKRSPTEVADLNPLIEKRAYELYLRRGGEGGGALEDWLEAERQVRAESGRA
jgi:hypothetical protein